MAQQPNDSIEIAVAGPVRLAPAKARGAPHSPPAEMRGPSPRATLAQSLAAHRARATKRPCLRTLSLRKEPTNMTLSVLVAR